MIDCQQFTERFTILQQIGAGGFGVVYKAHDRECDRIIALKSLRLHNAKALYRFKREFRALADVTHPNLVSLYELFSDGEQWFFTMEMVEGCDFITYVRGGRSLEDLMGGNTSTVSVAKLESETRSDLGAPTESESAPIAPRAQRQRALTVNLDYLRSALTQLADGLNALHGAGKLHCDIKPSNVLVTREGRVVILDFGLVADLAPDEQHESLEFAGTPNYMSPEQATGMGMSPASDWYSVGVMLFEALTGQLPFRGKFFEVLSQKQQFDAMRASELAADVPRDLDDLCASLLRRIPDQRLAGAEILKRLGEQKRALFTSSSTHASFPTALIGRERHLAELSRAFDEAQQGRAVVVRLPGTSGMGKSALARHFLEIVHRRAPDAVILTGRCYEKESVPYKALDSTIDALSRYLQGLSAHHAETLMPRDVQALARLFPVLRQVTAVNNAQRRVLESADSQALRRRAFAALRELLARIGDHRPLLLFIDDLQWGDCDSAALLAELLRPPEPPALLLLVSYRSEETEASPLLKNFLPAIKAYGSEIADRELPVDELNFEDARRLALELLGDDFPAREQRAAAIAADSGGNPFFIGELARYSQALPGEPSSRVEAADLSLDRLIQTRVDMLPADERRLLEVVALAGQPLEIEVATHAAGLQHNIADRLATLRNSHLLRTTGARGSDELETYHDRIRETVIAHLPGERLKEHHERMALALESARGNAAERMAVHYYLAGNIARATEYAVKAGDRAAEALAFDHAVQLYRFALKLGGLSADEARQVQHKLANI